MRTGTVLPKTGKTGGFSQTVKNEEFTRAQKNIKSDSIIGFSREGRAFSSDYLIFLSGFYEILLA
jgi:hypothetical protein